MNPIIKEKLKQVFEANIPDSLYQTYEELSQNLGSTPKTWETFLDDPEIQRLIEQKLSKYLNIQARKALNTLSQNPNLSSQEVAAIKHIIESSSLLKQKAETKQHILVTNIQTGGTQ